MFIFVFYSILGVVRRGSARVVRGLVRRQSADPVRSGGPRTGGQCFRVTPRVAKLDSRLDSRSSKISRIESRVEFRNSRVSSFEFRVEKNNDLAG